MIRSASQASSHATSHQVQHRHGSAEVVRVVFSAALIATFAIAFAHTAQAADGQAAYVDTTALNLRVAAGTKSAIVGILLKYDSVTVLSRQKVGSSTWYEIEASGGYTNGFVSARYVQFGDAPAGAVVEETLDYGAQETPTLMRGQFKYVGPKACAECHEDSTGEFPKGASTVWNHTVHSAAYKTLSKDYTIEIAKRKRNIDDPVNDWRCVKCHTTAFGAPPEQLTAGYSNEDGVSCEVCHGPGGGYIDEDHGPSNASRGDLGFRILSNLTERREVCTSCHNVASPTYKPFNLREFSRTIAHWIDPGDRFYYEDAVSEATRRQKRVDKSRAEQPTTTAPNSKRHVKKRPPRLQLQPRSVTKSARLAKPPPRKQMRPSVPDFRRNRLQQTQRPPPRQPKQKPRRSALPTLPRRPKTPRPRRSMPTNARHAPKSAKQPRPPSPPKPRQKRTVRKLQPPHARSQKTKHAPRRRTPQGWSRTWKTSTMSSR